MSTDRGSTTDGVRVAAGRVSGATPGTTPGRMAVKLFLVSVLALYLELLLIRWIGTEIRIFAYLQNTVLVVCFFGLGIGLFTADRPVDYWRGARALLLIATLLLIPVTRDALKLISETLSVLGVARRCRPAPCRRPLRLPRQVRPGRGEAPGGGPE